MEYSEKVIPLMRALRTMLLSKWGKVDVRYKEGARRSVVTDVDDRVEAYMSKHLRALFPNIPFVGEESGGDRSASKFWLMDPIDGTREFIEGKKGCTSMIALISRDKVVFSVVYDFCGDAMYSAEKGKGAYRNGVRIHASRKKTLDGAIIVLETNTDKEENRLLRYRLNARVPIIRSTIAGSEFIRTAMGEIDARINIDPYGHDYDFAAGSLLVSEAGGLVRNIGKKGFDYRNLDFYAGSPHLARHFIHGKV